MVSRSVRKLLLLFLLMLAAAPGADAATLLVFPPENLTKSAALNWVGEGIAFSISEQCQSPDVETISWEERSRFIEASDLPPNTTLSRASMIRLAQRASVDFLIFGNYTGTEGNLRISLRALRLKTMKLSGEMEATGPVTALPQLENELAWVILSNNGFTGALTREAFKARTRVVPNRPYSMFIESLAVTDESARFNLLQKALAAYRDFPQASFLLGVYYFLSGDCVKTVQYLKPALRDAQDYLEAQFMLGTCSLRQDKPEDAIGAYSAILTQLRSLEVFNNIGVAYLRKGDYPMAMQYLANARNMNKADVTVAINLAVLQRLQGDDKAALAVLDDLVKAHPDLGMPQYLYSLALASQGQAEKAAAARERAAKLGIDAEKMSVQDPRTWTRLFSAWTRRPASILAGEAKY